MIFQNVSTNAALRAWLLGAALWLGLGQVLAQDASFQLLDAEDQSPIIGASFRYGAQQGVSDLQGRIGISPIEGEAMQLSHVSYGQWALGPDALAEALRQGRSFRAVQASELQPATIIALRAKPLGSEALDFDHDERMAHDGGALLNATPAIASIRKSGAYGFDPVLRGFKYEQLNVVLDGAQSALAACPNRMDPPSSQMAPNMLRRVEILKGPHALRYGTAFGGTINFVSAAPRFSAQPAQRARLSSAYEGNGQVWRGEGQWGLSGSHYDWQLFGAWSQGQDYKDGAGNSVPADFRRGSFGSQLALKLGQGQHLSASATYNVARDADFAAVGMDLRKDDTWLFNLRHEWHSGTAQGFQSLHSTLYGSVVEHLMDNLLKPLDPRMMDASTTANTLYYGARSEGQWQWGGQRLFVGADWRNEEAEGTRSRTFLMGPNMGNTATDSPWQHARIRKGAAFAEWQLWRGPWHWAISGRLELNQGEALAPANEFSGVHPDLSGPTQANPSLSLGGQYHWANGLQAGLWLGRSQRSGSLTERYINFFAVGQDAYELLGDPLLKPEANHQIDLNLRWESPRTRLSLDLFGAYVLDAISSRIDPALLPRLMSSPGVRRIVNLGAALRTGLEATWQQQLWGGWQQHLSFAYTYGEDLERAAPLPEIAPFDVRYTLSASYLGGRLRPEATLRHVLAQERVSAEYGERASAAFTTVDLAASFRFARQWELRAGAQNLLDAHYFEHLNRPLNGGTLGPIYAPGRNVFVALAWAME